LPASAQASAEGRCDRCNPHFWRSFALDRQPRQKLKFSCFHFRRKAMKKLCAILLALALTSPIVLLAQAGGGTTGTTGQDTTTTGKKGHKGAKKAHKGGKKSKKGSSGTTTPPPK